MRVETESEHLQQDYDDSDDSQYNPHPTHVPFLNPKPRQQLDGQDYKEGDGVGAGFFEGWAGEGHGGNHDDEG